MVDHYPIPNITCMKNLFYFLIPLLLCLSCDQIKSYTEKVTVAENPNVVKKYHQNGKLRAYYEVNDIKKRHGDAKFYNEKGILTKSFVYENGEKINAMQYYENGNPLMEVNYINDAKDGYTRRFYENGKIESEILYRDNQPGKGLKEYSKSGKLRAWYPNFIIEPIDQLQTNGKYTINVYFDKQPARGNYYMGQLTDGIFMNTSLRKLGKSNYKGQFVMKPARGTILMEKLYFVGEYKTPTGNKYIVEKTFNLAIDNIY